MQTRIVTTKKLERLIKKLISTTERTEEGILGKWNATVFYVNRKKCWLITNAKTKYNVVLTDVTAKDLKNIDLIFTHAFHEQLSYDGIKTDFEKIESILGKLQFLPTDNDRSTIGFQNQRLMDLDWWKYEFETLENMPMIDLTNRMNKYPIRIGKSGTVREYTNPRKDMRRILLNRRQV